MLSDLASAFRPGPRQVGLEYELLPLDPETGDQIAYRGERSVERLLEWLVTHRGWSLGGDRPLLELERAGGRITLEPGAQIELSGAPQRSIAAVATELESFVDDLRTGASALGFLCVPLGVTPRSVPDAIEVIPKPRYGIMTSYLNAQGRSAWWMMRATAGMQVNLDAESPAAAARLLAIFLRAAPLMTAVYANSPLAAGRENGWRSRREQIWTEVDPARCGYPPGALAHDATLEAYVRWALDAPMFFIARDRSLIDMTGLPFRRFLAEGGRGHQPELADWHLHLTTLFPEVRIKRCLELRSVDSNTPERALSFAALAAGLAYGGEAVWAGAQRLLGSWNEAEHQRFHLECMRVGSAAQAPDGRSAAELLEQLVALAERGLEVWSPADQVWLEPVRTLAASGATPADDVLERFRRDGLSATLRALAI